MNIPLSNSHDLAFAWSGLPDYAARCIRAVIDRRGGGVTVIGTRPRVPIEGMEASLGQSVHWVDGHDRSITWHRFGMTPPKVFIQGGHFLPAFNALGRQARLAGACVVLASDQNWTGSWRQRFVDPIRARLMSKPRFDGVFVAGNSGERYYRGMSFPKEAIVQGMYGADPIIFNEGPPLRDRPKQLIFVGQFIQRKNVVALTKAFVRFSMDYPDWMLRICGSGEMRDLLPTHAGIQVEDFVQPPQLAALLRESRCLVLPSLREHWGLVVHEAALSGCALALTDVVGAAADLARAENAALFPPGDETAIEHALRTIATWNRVQWDQAETVSRALARKFGPERFADAVDQIVDTLRPGLTANQ